MYKILLKRWLFEIVQTMVFMEARLERLDKKIQEQSLPLVKEWQRQLQVIQDHLFERQDLLKSLASDGTTDEPLFEHFFKNSFPAIRIELEKLVQGIYRIDSREILPEAQMLINSLNLNKLGLQQTNTIVMMSLDTTKQPVSHELSWSTNEGHWIIPQPIGYLDISNPLRWFGLADHALTLFAGQSIQLQTLLEELELPPSVTSLTVPLLQLRILGPGYYGYYVLSSLYDGVKADFWTVEPLLFQGLNRFGFVNKDLVILHQSLEKAKGLIDSEETDLLLVKDDTRRENLLHLVEKVIPDRLAYTEKTFLRTQLLQDRLEAGILIGAVPQLTNPPELLEQLNRLDETDSIYPLLQQTRELPSNPREIVNAGLLYSLDQSNNWLDQALALPQVQAWELLRQKITELNANLLKSIETAEVFGILASQDAETVTPTANRMTVTI